MFKRAIIAAALSALAALPAHARHRGTKLAVVASAPILQSVSVPFGAITPAFRGYVFLNSQDVTTTSNQPVTFSGLDVWAGGNPCATWTETFVSGRSAGDYNLISADTPTASAITPHPTPTGATNATGTYVFAISCKDAGGHVSNTVNLTYVTVANAVNIGDGDRTDSGVTPAGFGNVAGAQILLSVGADFHAPAANFCCIAMRFFSGTFTNQVTITNADNARKPYLAEFTFRDSSGGMGNYQVNDLTLSGPVTFTDTVSGFTSAVAVDNVQWNRIHGLYSAALILNGGTGASGLAGDGFDGFGCATSATHCGIADSDFDFVGSGSTLAHDLYIKNTTFRHYYNNALYFQSGSVRLDIEDVNILSPMAPNDGSHADTCQVADGGTPNHVTMKRMIIAQADGDTQVQGCPFRGSLLNATCYQDDGTGAHSAGLVLTCPGGFQSDSNGSIIVIPGHYTYASNAVLTITSSTTGTLANVAAAVIGSPGSPVQTYDAGGFLDWNMDGIIVNQSEPNGFGTWGEGGTSSIKDFAFFQMNATPPGEASFTGSINSAGTTLTVSTTPTYNYPGETLCIDDCGRIAVTGICEYCGPNMAFASGTRNGIGTYTLSPTWSFGAIGPVTIRSSLGYPLTDDTVGFMDQGNIGGNFCTVTALHTGTYTISNGTVQAGGQVCGGSITNVTTSNWLNSGGTSMPAANYASGLKPQKYLEGKTWSSRVSSAPVLTNAQILALNCLALKPKIGGGLDLGGGNWIGPVTGETNAGTHTGGGNWIQNGADSGIAIPGCSAAP